MKVPSFEDKDDIKAIRIGKRLTKFRKAGSFTQRSLAQAVGTTHQTIARYESGETLIPALVLRRIAAALNVSPDAFFADE